jgi:predicted phage tail protein
MKQRKPKPNRTQQRNEIKHRLHTTIQAAAYLADDPGDDVIERELREIMKSPKPGRGLNPGPGPASDHRATGQVAVLAIFSVGATVALIIAWAAGHSSSLFSHGVALSLVGASQLAPAVRLLLLSLSDRSKRHQVLSGESRRARRRPGEFTGSQRDQSS